MKKLLLILMLAAVSSSAMMVAAGLKDDKEAVNINHQKTRAHLIK